MVGFISGECGVLLVFVKGLYSGVEPSDVVRETIEDGVFRCRPRLDSRVVEVAMEDEEEDDEEEKSLFDTIWFGG